jgi:hypothetical protein
MFSTASIDNIGMCIPINVAKPLIEQVLRDYSETEVPAETPAENQETPVANAPLLGKPRLGVTISSVSSQAVGVLPQPFATAATVTTTSGGTAAVATAAATAATAAGGLARITSRTVIVY